MWGKPPPQRSRNTSQGGIQAVITGVTKKKDTVWILKEHESGLLLLERALESLVKNKATTQPNKTKKRLEWGSTKLLLWPFDLRNKVVVQK